MVRIVRESDASSVPATAKKHAVSEQTVYLWRTKFGTLEAWRCGNDEHTRESLAIDVAGSIRSGKLIEVLTRLVSHHGASKYGVAVAGESASGDGRKGD